MIKEMNVYISRASEYNKHDGGYIRSGSYVFAIYIAFLPIATGLSGIVGNVSLLNYIALLYVVIEIMRRIRTTKLVFFANLKFVYWYFIYTITSCVWNCNFAYDWYFFTFLTTVLLFFLTTMNSYNERELRLFKNAVIFSIGVAFIAALMNINKHRLFWTVSSAIDPNVFACGLGVMIALLMTLMLNKKWIIIPLALLLLIIIQSGSRGALLMVVGMAGYWSFICMKNKSIMTILIVLLVVICGFFFFKDCFPQEWIGRFSISSVYNSGGAGRTKIWLAAFDTFIGSDCMRMIFGYGHGGFREAVNYVAIGYSFPYASHNMFVNALIEGGIIGLTLLLLAFVQVFRCASKNRNTWGRIAIVGFFIEGLSLDAQSHRIFALVFIIAVIYKEIDGYASSRLAPGYFSRTSI